MANLFGLQLMAIDSFVALKWPLQHHVYMKRSVVRVMIVTAWILAAILTFCYPLFIYTRIDKIAGSLIECNVVIPDNQFCRCWYIFVTVGVDDFMNLFNFNVKALLFLSRWKFAVLFTLTLIMLFVIYGYRAAVVRRIAKSLNEHQSFNKNISALERIHHMRKVQKKGFRITVVLFSTFYLLWTPCLILQYIKVVNGSVNVTHTGDLEFGLPERVCHVICCLTTIVDVLVYMIFMRSLELSRRIKGLRNKAHHRLAMSHTHEHSAVSQCVKRH